MKIAVCQLDISRDKRKNLDQAESMIRQAKADIVVLPEMFNCPYNAKTFDKYAEKEFSETTLWLQKLSKELGITLVGGSIPELDYDKMYNTSYTYHKGELVGKHRKAHLFDVDIKDGITFKESSVLAPGNKATVFDAGDVRIGVAICYDMRFPELIRTMVNEGADIIIIPAAFNTVTGPAHWHVTARARAIDNQVYFVVASPARSKELSYKAYGHSLVVNPWGEIVAEAGIDQEIIEADLDLNYLKKVRNELPLLKHRRKELYSL
ncbi:carbon-nitrogen hydrolase family protein [Acidaminobacter sp. JC074]|uniref:carbon-nitrogen hydrolase family protein n=1 Tax=Acidaminobacter sp. JC074 TaxID=2530199 RepID=UPI001F105190|nr:carbon-nitrogen hydrolase family protein [Acidaminobacter sp. JC074]MCH4889473.1 carbon-nitrogen hydrolase family protein [Acidaminobacter sp. JC074]